MKKEKSQSQSQIQKDRVCIICKCKKEKKKLKNQFQKSRVSFILNCILSSLVRWYPWNIKSFRNMFDHEKDVRGKFTFYTVNCIILI